MAASVTELNQRLVVMARTCADGHEVRLNLIRNDPLQAAEVATLNEDIQRLRNMADRWEKNPPQTL